MINARYDDEANVVTRHGAVHLGMAAQTENGLMVPVIRDAQSRNLWQLASEITRLAAAARDGSAKSEELSGSTLTLTSLGPLGGVAHTRSEEHTSELQSLMRISYAVFCLKKQKKRRNYKLHKLNP